jgi:hypothetical protein
MEYTTPLKLTAINSSISSLELSAIDPNFAIAA